MTSTAASAEASESEITPHPALSRDVCVVIPAFNEAETVAEVVLNAQRTIGAKVVVANDASTDDTAHRAAAAGAHVISVPLRLGAWGASQTGIRWARRRGFRYVITMDADGQHDPETLPQLLQAQREHDADLVIGTHPQRLSRAKRLAWFYIRQLTRLDIHDFTSGLRVYGPRALDIVTSGEATLLDYQDVGVLLLLRNRGARIIETPTVMHSRQTGHSRVFSSWLVVAHYMLQTTVLCVARLGHGRRKRREG